MNVRKATLALTLGLGLCMGLLGCGADPGAEFIDGDYVDHDLPISGALQKIVQGYDLLHSGSNAAARQVFLQVIADRPKNADLSMAKVGIGISDMRTLGTMEGLAEFREAYEADGTNPDARVFLAGALLSRAGNDGADVHEAVSLLEGIDPGNASFIYEDRFQTGMSNAEVHAILAYAYKLVGENTKSATQASIARSLDANLDDTTVDQILLVLDFLSQG